MVEHVRLAEIIQGHRRRFAYTCQCGEEGCPGPRLPSEHDPRVVAATLTTVMSELDNDWDPRLLSAASAYGKEMSQCATPEPVVRSLPALESMSAAAAG